MTSSFKYPIFSINRLYEFCTFTKLLLSPLGIILSDQPVLSPSRIPIIVLKPLTTAITSSSVPGWKDVSCVDVVEYLLNPIRLSVAVVTHFTILADKSLRYLKALVVVVNSFGIIDSVLPCPQY